MESSTNDHDSQAESLARSESQPASEPEGELETPPEFLLPHNWQLICKAMLEIKDSTSQQKNALQKWYDELDANQPAIRR